MPAVIAVAGGVAGVAIVTTLFVVIIVSSVGVSLQLIIAIGVVVLEATVASLAVLYLEYAIEVSLFVHPGISLNGGRSII